MAELSIQAESDLGKVIAELAAQGKSIDRLLPAIAELVVGAVHDVVEAEGPGWPPLAESTMRQRRGNSYKMLQDTGVFLSSVAPQWGSTYAEAVDGTSYGHFHVTGGLGGTRPPVRDWTNLGEFESGLLEDVAEMVTGVF